MGMVAWLADVSASPARYAIPELAMRSEASLVGARNAKRAGRDI
jgi:hypothetical protein